jgi:hypothetical protein
MRSGRIIRVVDGIVAVGWRAWTVQETSEGIRLGSVIHDLQWQPRELATAFCEKSHRVPSGACNCGFHAARDPVDVFSYLHGRDELHTIGRVLGEVLLGGCIVETDVGWRAATAYPQRLYVEDQDLAASLAPYAIPILSTSCGSHSSPTCTETRSRFAPSLPSWSVTSPV